MKEATDVNLVLSMTLAMNWMSDERDTFVLRGASEYCMHTDMSSAVEKCLSVLSILILLLLSVFGWGGADGCGCSSSLLLVLLLLLLVLLFALRSGDGDAEWSWSSVAWRRAGDWDLDFERERDFESRRWCGFAWLGEGSAIEHKKTIKTWSTHSELNVLNVLKWIFNVCQFISVFGCESGSSAMTHCEVLSL